MPIRDQTRPATAKTVSEGTPNVVTLKQCLGTYQSIAGLNYGPRPRPGIWVVHPNTIMKSHNGGGEVPNQTHRISNKIYSIEGDVSAIHMALKGYSPPYSTLEMAAWSTTRANEAASRAYAKIMAADLDVGVMIGELRETLEGIRNPLSGLRNYLRKRGASGNDFVSMLSSSWLEWRYGIRPIIQTIQDIYEHVNSEIAEWDGKLHRKRGRAPEVKTISSLVENVQISPYMVENEFKIEKTTRYSASVGYSLTSPLTLNERYGLDAFSLPAIAWELTTLSFVVDWWLNIGTWLKSLKVLDPKVQIAGISVSQKAVTTVSAKTTGKAWIGSTPVQLNGRGSAHFLFEGLQRTAPSPAFTGVTPSVNSKAFDLARSIDGLTLLWQRIAKGR